MLQTIILKNVLEVKIKKQPRKLSVLLICRISLDLCKASAQWFSKEENDSLLRCPRVQILGMNNSALNFSHSVALADIAEPGVPFQISTKRGSTE